MATNTDILLQKNDSKIYDISISSSGDFVKVQGFETAILMSLFGEVRANESEVRQPELRRGWIGNEHNDVEGYEVGSKLWLLFQSRAIQETLNRAIEFSQNGFQWMIDNNFAKEVNVDGTLLNANILLDIDIIRIDNVTENRQFMLWDDTDFDNIICPTN